MQHFVFTKTPTKKCSSSLIAKIHVTRLCNFFLLWVLFRNSQLEFIEIMSKNERLKLLPSWVGDLACQVSAHENSHNRVTGYAAERGRSRWKSRQALYHFKHQDRTTGELSPAADSASLRVLDAGMPPLGTPLGAMLDGALLSDAPAPSSPQPEAPWPGRAPCPLLPGVGIPSVPGAGPAPRQPPWRSCPLLFPLGWEGCFFWPLLLSSGI